MKSDDDDRIGERSYQPRHLRKRMENGGVCRTDLVKKVARNQDEIRRWAQEIVDVVKEQLG